LKLGEAHPRSELTSKTAHVSKVNVFITRPSQEGKGNDLPPSYFYNACGSYKVNKSDQYFGEDEFFE